MELSLAIFAIVATSLTSVIASSGFWAYMMKKNLGKGANTRLLMGLAYDKIISVGMGYLERGWISMDEYQDFRRYLYEPYSELGGNGTAKRIMDEVSKLPIKRQSTIDVIMDAKSDHKEAFDSASRIRVERENDRYRTGEGLSSPGQDV